MFGDAAVTGLVLFLEAAPAEKACGETRFITIDDWTETKNLNRTIRTSEPGDTEWGHVTTVDQSSLDPTTNWESLFDQTAVDFDGLASLGEFASIQRGPSTGDVGFFVLTQDEVDALGLDPQHLTPIVRWSRMIDGYDFRTSDWDAAREAGGGVWLLDPDTLDCVPDDVTTFREKCVGGSAEIVCDSADAKPDEALLKYLRQGITEYELHTVSILDDRPVWYRPRRKAPPKVLVTFADREAFTFAFNEAGVRNISSLYGFYEISIGDDELKALLAYLHSSIGAQALRQQARTLEDGYRKLDPSDIESVRVIDPTELPRRTMRRLATEFDALRETARNGGDCEAVIDRIDSILADELEQ